MRQLLWIPADMPKLENKNLLIVLYKCEYKNNENAKAFESQQFTIRTENYQSSTFKDEYVFSHKFLINYIREYLPFDQLVNVKIHRPVNKGRTHIDFLYPEKNLELFTNNHQSEPCGYRMIINGSRHGQLYIKTNGKKIYPQLPETTDWYIVGSTNAPHGLNNKDSNRFILFCHGYINKKKHHDLLDRSLSKYKNYAIWSENESSHNRTY